MNAVKEFNEFCWDMVRALPICYYYHDLGIDYYLEHKPNLSSVYYFVKNKKEVTQFNEINLDETYAHSRPNFTKKNWNPPPIKKDFQGILQFDKPALVINNKYAREWRQNPSNFIDVNSLDYIFSNFKQKYQILYIRPALNTANYFMDQNEILKFNDYEFIADKHPQIITIYDLLDKHPNLDFNTLQFAMHAASDKHISASGGNACLSAYFKGDLIIYDTINEVPGRSLRGIWQTNSWLELLSGSNITTANNYKQLLNIINEKL
jgi:hypothetical protein